MDFFAFALFIITPLFLYAFFIVTKFYLVYWLLFAKKGTARIDSNKYDFKLEPFYISYPEKNKTSLFAAILPSKQQNEKVKIALFAHGNGQTHKDMFSYANYFIEDGWTSVFFDFQSCGSSTGKYTTMGSLEVKDIQLVVDAIYKKFDIISELVIIGHSMGAVAAAVYSSKDTRVTGLILDSVYSSAIKVLNRKITPITNISKWYSERILNSVGDSYFKISKNRITETNPEYSLMRTTVPVLLIHGDEDRFISPSMPLNIYFKRKDKFKTRIVIFASTKHGEAIIKDQNRYINEIQKFIADKENYSVASFSSLGSSNSCLAN